MKNIVVTSDNIITSLGFTTHENLENMKAGKTGISLHDNDRLYPEPFWASVVDDNQLNEIFSSFGNRQEYSRFEKMVICSVKDAVSGSGIDVTDRSTLLILSTTKGNIDLLDERNANIFDPNRVYLWESANILQKYFKLYHKPLIVSNACISGLIALIIGSRLIRNGKYENVIVTGADLVTEFVLSGFKSFQSLCSGPCKPFDKDRQGLSLGEGAGTIVLSATSEKPSDSGFVYLGAGFSSNDANHISGPSRTGEGLYSAIMRTLAETEMKIDHISAHGTATPYNDEMEAIAITRAGLQKVPVNSLKGYWGHTLGAAGIIETAACIYSLSNNQLINTLGYNTLGVSKPVAVVNKTYERNISACLKIASGFGGCNASLLLHK